MVGRRRGEVRREEGVERRRTRGRIGRIVDGGRAAGG